MNFRYKLMQFMSGRYGIDALFNILFVLGAVLAFINIFLRLVVLQLIIYAIIIYALFRVLSRNIPARSRENRAAQEVINRIKSINDVRRQRRADYTHIYKKCPHCRAVLRLPRKAGKHKTVCPRCGKEFSVRVFRE